MRSSRSRRWNLTRRDSLKLLAGGAALTALNPMRALIESLADGFIRQVLAEETGAGAGSRNLVSLGIFFAPPRWYWDLPLFPYSGGTDPENAHVVTRFSGSTSAGGTTRYTDASYATHSFGGIALPHLWSSNIPTSDVSGTTFGRTTMTTLAQNMAILRGIRQVGDGHDFLHGKFLRPDASAPSVHGILADQSTNYIPAAQLINGGLDFANFFSSRLGTALANGTIAQSPLDSLLQPFRRTTANPFGSSGTPLISRRDAITGAMNEALDIIAEAAKAAAPGSDALYAARGKAEEFLEQGLEDFSSEFEDIRRKYMELVRLSAACMNGTSGPVTGLSDQHISTFPSDAPATGLAYNRINQSNMNGGTLIQASSISDGDLRGMIQARATAYTAANSGSPTDTTLTGGLHEIFAVIEFLLSRGYSSSISASFGSITNLNLQAATFTNNLYELTTTADETTRTRKTAGTISSHSFDEHAAGAGGRNISLLLCSTFYHQLSSCLLHLTQAIGTSTFENTVIQVSNEFSRSPNKDGWGSEHGVYAGVASIFSGAIKNPLVVGNTTMHPSATSPSYTYYGHWGVGGLTETTAGLTHLGAGHVASTLAHLLRIESPTPNFPSLLTESGGTVTSSVATPASEVDE